MKVLQSVKWGGGGYFTHNYLTLSKNVHMKKQSIAEEKYESRFPQKVDSHCSSSHSTVAVIADGWKLGNNKDRNFESCSESAARNFRSSLARRAVLT